MNAKRATSYLITAAMLAGALLLPMSASAHGFRDDGYYYRDHHRHQPAPKWRKHRGHYRAGRDYVYVPRRHVPARTYITVPGVRLGRGNEVDIIYRRYWD
jgi:hypothetical protein